MTSRLASIIKSMTKIIVLLKKANKVIFYLVKIVKVICIMAGIFNNQILINALSI